MSSENPEETTIGIAALVAAVAALLFAVVQTIAALAQLLVPPFLSLSWNPQYRMPVLTMPGLRSEPVVTMERDPSNAEFRPGKNYDKKRNGYLDYGVLRVVAGSDASKVHREVSMLPTVLRGSFAAHRRLRAVVRAQGAVGWVGLRRKRKNKINETDLTGAVGKGHGRYASTY
ncbi:hypothetical protein QC761_305503 [Podospora bellae-mahoneyi]|uniref:Uncharacterized protein n=1 Tax=Podospora bellae-mahoneyi TaxID=2093777 RepID=A0ABR0FN53_9PEZI|nr:hypothetical protein QC761_305503 [Podospora bellae-mahoneyi]